MVGGADKKPKGRRGGKKARGRAGGGTNGGRSNNQGDNGGGAGAVDGGQSFPVVSDSRFSSMHSAPVSVGYGRLSRHIQQPRFMCGGAVPVTCGGGLPAALYVQPVDGSRYSVQRLSGTFSTRCVVHLPTARNPEAQPLVGVLYSKLVELHRYNRLPRVHCTAVGRCVNLLRRRWLRGMRWCSWPHMSKGCRSVIG